MLTSARSGLVRQSEHFVSQRKHDTDGYNIIPYGYCTYRNRSDDGQFAFNLNTVSDHAIVSKFYPVFTFHDADSRFMTEYLNASQRVKQKLSVLAVGTSQVVLSFETFRNAVFSVPSFAEQQKIAQFIRVLNCRIEKQQILIASLKSYKRGLLNAFFSREICFAENAAWEVRQFNTVAELRKDKYDPAKETPATCIELEHIEQGTGRILGHTMAETQSSIKNKFLHGDVLFGKLRPYLRKYALPGFEGVCSSEIWVLTPKHGILSQYLYYLVQSEQFVATANISSGTKMPRAEWSKISAERIFVPNGPEQEKICNTLEALDRRIDSALITLTKLDQLKSGLLQRMFI